VRPPKVRVRSFRRATCGPRVLAPAVREQSRPGNRTFSHDGTASRHPPHNRTRRRTRRAQVAADAGAIRACKDFVPIQLPRRGEALVHSTALIAPLRCASASGRTEPRHSRAGRTQPVDGGCVPGRLMRMCRAAARRSWQAQPVFRTDLELPEARLFLASRRRESPGHCEVESGPGATIQLNHRCLPCCGPLRSAASRGRGRTPAGHTGVDAGVGRVSPDHTWWREVRSPAAARSTSGALHTASV